MTEVWSEDSEKKELW